MMSLRKNRTGGLIPTIILAVMITFGIPAQKVQAQPGYDIDYQVFYDELSPYGQWLNYPQYGYVWSPNVGSDFRPYYSNGYWAMTDYGNMWMSNYSWGWAPFHYGRWTFDDYYGWLWIPGSEWGPAWVSWRQGGGHYGWAPLGPGISINISFGNSYYAPNSWWTFVPNNRIYYRNGYSRYYSPRNTINIYNNTTIINNTYYDNRSHSRYVSGPRKGDVERYTGKVTTYGVRNANNRTSGVVNRNEVQIYKPQVNTSRNTSNIAPKAVKNIENSKIDRSNTNRSTVTSPSRGTSNPPVDRNIVAPNKVNNRTLNSTTPQKSNTTPTPNNNTRSNEINRINTPATPQQSRPTQKPAMQEQPVKQTNRNHTPQKATTPSQRQTVNRSVTPAATKSNNVSTSPGRSSQNSSKPEAGSRNSSSRSTSNTDRGTIKR